MNAYRLYDKKYKIMSDEVGYEDIYLTHDKKVHEIGEYFDYGGGGKTVEDVTKQYEVMMSTGLEDCNGVEIYEGDICKYSNKAKNGTIIERIFLVVFDSASFICVEKNSFAASSVGYYTTLAKGNGLEVIGNKYDNPELLE